MNIVLSGEGLTQFAEEEDKVFVGNGLEHMVSKLLPPEETRGERHKLLINSFRPMYPNNWIHTKPFAGIQKVLDQLDHWGIPMGVLSNKPHEFTCRMVQTFFQEHQFILINGAQSGYPNKPDPTLINTMIRKLNVQPEQTLMIGDAEEDVQTARYSGMKSIGVSWVLNPRSQLIDSRADWIADHPKEILEIVRSLR